MKKSSKLLSFKINTLKTIIEIISSLKLKIVKSYLRNKIQKIKEEYDEKKIKTNSLSERSYQHLIKKLGYMLIYKKFDSALTKLLNKNKML